MMTEREQLERVARWSCDQLLAAMSEAERAAESHNDLLSELLPAGHSAMGVIDELIDSLKETRRKIR